MLYNKLAEQQEKLDKLCEDNDLEYSFSRDDFPIIFTFRPQWEKAAQMKFDMGQDEPTTDPEARIELVFGNELTLRSFGDFVIDDDQLNKIKNSAKKIHYLYLQLYFCQQKQKEKMSGGRPAVDQEMTDELEQEEPEEETDREMIIDKETGEIHWKDEEAS